MEFSWWPWPLAGNRSGSTHRSSVPLSDISQPDFSFDAGASVRFVQKIFKLFFFPKPARLLVEGRFDWLNYAAVRIGARWALPIQS